MRCGETTLKWLAAQYQRKKAPPLSCMSRHSIPRHIRVGFCHFHTVLQGMHGPGGNDEAPPRV